MPAANTHRTIGRCNKQATGTEMFYHIGQGSGTECDTTNTAGLISPSLIDDAGT